MKPVNNIIQAIYYLLSQLGSTDKMKLIKLLYLADKYHLIHYGRTLTEDTYYAMNYGPVGSLTRDIMEFNDKVLKPGELQQISVLFEPKDTNEIQIKESAIAPGRNNLSDSDLEALSFVLDHYGNMEIFELVKLTHEYPEWQKHEKDLQQGNNKRKEIPTEELASTIPGDPYKVTKEHLQYVKDMIRGNF